MQLLSDGYRQYIGQDAARFLSKHRPEKDTSTICKVADFHSHYMPDGQPAGDACARGNADSHHGRCDLKRNAAGNNNMARYFQMSQRSICLPDKRDCFILGGQEAVDDNHECMLIYFACYTAYLHYCNYCHIMYLIVSSHLYPAGLYEFHDFRFVSLDLQPLPAVRSAFDLHGTLGDAQVL